MKVVFVEHPCPVLLHGGEPWSPIRTNTWPQSQITLAASISDEYDVEILDLRSLPSPADWRQEVGPEYLKPILYGRATLTRHLIGNYRDRIAQHPADVFVFTANFTSEANAVAEIIRATKKQWPEALILVGGSDASPEERHQFYLEAGADYIGVGDGDVALPIFLDEIQAGGRPKDRLIKGGVSSGFKLADPNFALLQPERYIESGGGPIHPGIFKNGGFAAYTEISRGCSRECDFCSARRTAIWSPPIDEVLKHLDHIIDSGCRLLMFSDDNLLLARKTEELVTIFRHLRERRIAWEFPNGLEVGLLIDHQRGNFREELFETLFWNSTDRSQFVGAHRLLVPIEDALLHRSSLSKLKGVQVLLGGLLRRLLDTGIPFLNLAIMIGGVQESREHRERLEIQLELIYNWIQGSKTRVNFSIFCTSPLPGTGLGRAAMKSKTRLSHGIDKAPELWTVFTSVLNGDHFTAEQTTKYRLELLRRFHMSQEDGKVLPRS